MPTRDPKALADPGAPFCPFCGCARHDSERLHDSNMMLAGDLVVAMLAAFMRDPDGPSAGHITQSLFPGDFTPDAQTRLRAKMEVALGVAVRNMPYLAALRADAGPDAAAEMRERCARIADQTAENLKDAPPSNAELLARIIGLAIRKTPLTEMEARS